MFITKTFKYWPQDCVRYSMDLTLTLWWYFEKKVTFHVTLDIPLAWCIKIGISIWNIKTALYGSETFADPRIAPHPHSHPPQKMKFSNKNFFGKCDQICRKQRIWLHLLKKSLIENFSFSAMKDMGSCSVEDKRSRK